MQINPDKKEQLIKYWQDSAEKDYGTMSNLMNSKDYHWALFIGHLVIEKYLKALFVKKNHKQAIFSHDLLRLAHEADLDLTEERKDWLEIITTFNINARYDNYKQRFYRLCTQEFSEKWVNRITMLKIWLTGQL